MPISNLHEQLVDQAVKQGWHRVGWRKAFKARLATLPWTGDAKDVAEIIDQVAVVPDAWRVVHEGPITSGRRWGCSIVVLEFLEVDVTHCANQDKWAEYQDLWWQFDGTGHFQFRAFRMDRYGNIHPYVTEDTIYDILYGRVTR